MLPRSVIPTGQRELFTGLGVRKFVSSAVSKAVIIGLFLLWFITANPSSTQALVMPMGRNSNPEPTGVPLFCVPLAWTLGDTTRGASVTLSIPFPGSVISFKPGAHGVVHRTSAVVSSI